MAAPSLPVTVSGGPLAEGVRFRVAEHTSAAAAEIARLPPYVYPAPVRA